ncbi:MAG: hypothetical protein IMZ46_02335 [Acidobacteria bacterium]|nr:hypothetical protein [Acidobacteriota bacterium]
MKKALTIILVLFACGGAFALYQELRGLKTGIADLKALDAAAQVRIAEKEKANLALTIENVALCEKDAAGEVEKTRLRADLATKTAENDKLRNDLKTAPPETVLATVQGYLNTTEIWLRSNAANQVEAAFSLAAFRLDADALAERHYFKFTLVPNLEGQLRVSEGQNATKAVVIVNLEQMVKNAAYIIDEKDVQLGARDETIGALKKRNLWRDVGKIAFAFALGYITHGK